jgi:tRNA (adenine22-N1)-methyltransferase
MNLADIGTDHAMLPILAVKQGNVMKAQAIDNKEGPFVIAMSNVYRYKLKNKIKVVLADGISKIDDDTDVVVIAGMGGELITNILTKDNTKDVKRFILQPNNNAHLIRESLMDIGYYIFDEIVLEDQGKIYDILVIEKGDSTLTEKQVMFGPLNLEYKPHFFIKRLEKELNKLSKVLPNISNVVEKEKALNRINLIKEVLQ